MIKEIAYISARLVRKDKETNDVINQGTATIVVDQGEYYLITAYHCVERWEDDNCTIPADLSLMSATLVLYERTIDIAIDTKKEWNGDRDEDWAVIPILKPDVDFDYINKVRILTDYSLDVIFHSFAFLESEADGVYMTLLPQNNRGMLGINGNLVDGHSKINMVLKGGSGAGVFLFQNGIFYLVGHLKKTAKGGNLNCVKMVSSSEYDIISDELFASYSTISTPNNIVQLAPTDLLAQLQSMVNTGTSNIKEIRLLVRNILNDVVGSEIEHLRIKNASKILCSIKELCKDIIKSDAELEAITAKLDVECGEVEISFSKEAPIIYEELQNLISIPHDITKFNLNDWLQLLSSMRATMMDFVALDYTTEWAKRVIPGVQLYGKFISLVDKTDIADKFDVIRAFHTYWRFLEHPDKELLKEFQQLKKENIEEIHIHEVLMECSMLHMCDETDEAFSLLKSINDITNISVANFTILLGYHSKRNDFILWALNYCKDKNLLLDSSICKNIAISLNKENANDIYNLLNDLKFEISVEQNILLQRCKYIVGEPFDILSLLTHLDSASDIMLAYAAQMLAAQGHKKHAYDLLRPRVDTDTLDLRQAFLMNIMTTDKEMYTDLYRLLCNSLKRGNDMDKSMLITTYQMAKKLSDVNIAFKVIEKLYSQTPNDEWTFVNFVMTLSEISPEKLINYEQKALNYSYMNTNSVRGVYSIFVQNGYLQTALDVLYNNMLKLESDELESLYIDQCIIGGIKPLVEAELDTVIDGCYIVYEQSNGNKRCRKVKSSTPFGDSVIGKHKDDTFNSVNDGDLVIESIRNKYFDRSFHCAREMMDNGGNATHKVFHLDMSHPETILQQFEDAIKSFGVSSIDAGELLEQEYANGQNLLLALARHNDLIGGMYKCLFTNFNILVFPWQHYEVNKKDIIANRKELALDLPALILLFEFENKTGFHYSHRFVISTYLEQLIKSYRKNYQQIMSLDFIQGIQSGNLKRFSADINEDMEMRLDALLQWIEDNCESRPAIEALQLTFLNETPTSSLLSHTMVAPLNENVILVSDECNFESMIQSSLPMISTEYYIYNYEGLENGKAFTSFLIDCNFVGVQISPIYILLQYLKKESGENNQLEYALATVGRSPYLFPIAIDACTLIINYARNRLMAEKIILEVLSKAAPTLGCLTDKGQQMKKMIGEHLGKTKQKLLLGLYNKHFNSL